MLACLARPVFFVGSLVSGVPHLAPPTSCVVGVAQLPRHAQWVHTHWVWPTQSARLVLDMEKTPLQMVVFAPQVPHSSSERVGPP